MALEIWGDLSILWAEQGHEVFFGSRDSQKGIAIAEAGNDRKNALALPLNSIHGDKGAGDFNRLQTSF